MGGISEAEWKNRRVAEPFAEVIHSAFQDWLMLAFIMDLSEFRHFIEPGSLVEETEISPETGYLHARRGRVCGSENNQCGT
jgi:hypothetical protein